MGLGLTGAQALDPAKSILQYRLTQWGVDDGLAHGSVHMIEQDPRGFLWVGTLVGLSRFDGVRFVDAAPLPGQRTDYFVRSVVFEDDQRAAWAVMSEGGVARRVDHRWHTFAFPELGNARALASRRGGGLWVGGERGLFAMNTASTKPTLSDVAHPIKGTVWFIEEEADGRLWVGAESGTHLREADGRWRHLEAEFNLVPRVTWRILKASDGVYWIGGRNGLLRFDGRALKRYTQADGLALATVRGLAEDHSGALWIATPGGGLQRFRHGQFETLTTQKGLASDSVMTVKVDRTGNIWVGMAGGGIARLSDPPIRSFRKRDGLTGDWVWSIHQDEAGDVWIGTNGNGVSVMRGDQVVRRIPGTTNGLDTVWALHSWDRGRAIVSATQGIGRIEVTNNVTWLHKLAPGEPPPRVFLRLINGRLLVVKGRRFFEVRAGGLADIEGPQLPGVVTSVIENADGTLTASTRQGALLNIDLRQKPARIDVLVDNVGAPLGSLQRDADGRLWASANGVFIYDGARQVRVGVANGFPDRNSNQLVLTRDGELWMGTNRGIIRARQSDLLKCLDDAQCKPALQTLDERDGLVTAETNGGAQPNGWVDVQGRIWLPAINGAIRIDPVLQMATLPLPAAAIDAVRADRAPVAITSGAAHVPPNPGDLEIDYTLPELTLPKQVRFRYRLLPMQSDWIEAGGRRTAYFSALKPGRYTLEVQATRTHGEWPAETARQRIDVAAAWYQTLVARAAAGGALLAALLLAPWLRIRALRHRKVLLENEVANRTSELAAVNRQLDTLARTDVLTGIANRREFGERLAERCRKTDGREALLVMIADIDDFKAYNDHYGHPEGDACLRAVAQAITQALDRGSAGRSALSARYGGEEFAVLASVRDTREAAAMAQNIVDTVRKLARPHEYSRAANVVTLSLGFAVSSDRSCDPTAMLQSADRALYRAKEEGRNRWCAGQSL